MASLTSPCGSASDLRPTDRAFDCVQLSANYPTWSRLHPSRSYYTVRQHMLCVKPQFALLTNLSGPLWMTLTTFAEASHARRRRSCNRRTGTAPPIESIIPWNQSPRRTATGTLHQTTGTPEANLTKAKPACMALHNDRHGPGCYSPGTTRTFTWTIVALNCWADRHLERWQPAGNLRAGVTSGTITPPLLTEQAG